MDNMIETLVDIKENLRDLHTSLHEWRKVTHEEKDKGYSYLAELYGALAKAQGIYEPLQLNREGAGGAYADLDSVMQATRGALSANGLCFIQEIILTGDAGAVLLKTKIAHESGGVIESTARVIHQTTDRETGKSYEFLKRLHATTLLGIAPSRNDPELFDDNGIAQSEAVALGELTRPSKKTVDRRVVVDDAQYKLLLVELDKYPEIVAEVLRFHNIETLADLPKDDYYKALDKIRRIKHNAEEYNKSRLK
jgi:hypothetical protein